MTSAGKDNPTTDMNARSDDRLLNALEQLLAIDAVELDDALDRATLVVADALRADKVDAFLLEPSSQTLVARGTSDTPMGRLQVAVGMDRLPLVNGGRTVEVFQTGEPYITGHADEDPGQLIGMTRGLGIRSMMVVALSLPSGTRGVLAAASATPEFYTERDLRSLQVICGWVGLVAQRVELIQRIAGEAREEGRRRAAEELITVVAHDLRNYLTPLRARIDLIRRRAERGKRSSDVQDATVALHEINRLTQVIVTLLDVGRLEQGLFGLNPQPVDLADLCRATAEALAVPDNPIEVSAPEEVVAVVDADRVRQALENLLSNALRYSPRGASVRVDVSVTPGVNEVGKPGKVVIAVVDQGPGIPSDLLPRLFTRFTAGRGSTGLGLGLYLASHIASAHGGDLTVESPPGQGARFLLTLPLDNGLLPGLTPVER